MATTKTTTMVGTVAATMIFPRSAIDAFNVQYVS